MAKKTRKTEPAQPKRKATRKAKATLTVSSKVDLSGERQFFIFGQVTDPQRPDRVKGLGIDALAKGPIINHPFGERAITDEQGSFRIQFSESYLLQCFPKNRPNFFFRVYCKDLEIAVNKPPTVTWPPGNAWPPVGREIKVTGFEVTVRDECISGPPEKIYHILGEVIDTLHADRVGGLRLEARADRNGVTHSFGSDVTTAPGTTAPGTTAPGSFHVQFSETYLRERFPAPEWPEFYFKAFCKNLEITKIEPPVIIRPSETVIQAKVRLTVPDECGSGGGGQFIVKGHIHQADCSPLIGARVRVVDRDMRSEKQLGEKETDNFGYYELPYTADQFSQWDKPKERADLIVYALKRDGTGLADSKPIRFNAGDVEVIDIMVGGGVYPGPSEHEQLMTELTPLLENIQIAELTADDIAFLTNETGISSVFIEFLVQAAKRADETNLEPAVFYGFFRQNLPTGLSALLAQSSQTHRSALVAALDNNIIPCRLRGQLDQIIQRLQDLIVDQAFKAPTGRTSLSDLVKTTLPDANKQRTLFTMFVSHQGKTEDFWAMVRNHPDFQQPGLVDNLQYTLQVGALSNNHLPMVEALQLRRQDGSLPTLRSLAKLNVSGWLQIINSIVNGKIVGFPLGIPGANLEEQKQNYAAILTRIVQDAFPTAVIAAQISRDNGFPGKTDLVTFFNNPVNSNFEFGPTILPKYLADNPNALSGVSDVPGTKRQLRRIQRLAKLTPNFNEIRALLTGDLSTGATAGIKGDSAAITGSGEAAAPALAQATPIDSAQAITNMGPVAFVTTYSAAFGGEQRAMAIYNNAASVSGAAANLYIDHSARNNRVHITNVPYDPPIVGIPDLETLFGSLDLCECEHCRSVHSPAAYLVDLLAFLRNRKSKIAGESAKKILFGRRLDRRPELGEVELTCENTNTPLPYVDLVNEVLENAIAPFARFNPYNIIAGFESALNARTITSDLRNAFNPHLSEHAVITVKKLGEWWTIDDAAFTYNIRKEGGNLRVLSRSLQTSGTAQERAANPQYVNVDAYDKLAEAIYPWNLPLNLWVEESRLFLDHLGVPRHELMKTFQKRTGIVDPPEIAIANERLGLTTFESQVITGGLKVRAATTAPITTSGLITVDGVMLEAGNLVLVKDQASDAGNGIYMALTGEWTRTDHGARSPVLVRAQNGTSNTGKRWLVIRKADQTFEVTEVQPWQFWGLGENNNEVPDPLPNDPDHTAQVGWVEALRRVRVFLDRSGLSYQEVTEMLKTRFINPGKLISIVPRDQSEPDTCDTTRLVFNDELNIAALNRIHRFLRLWRELGWTMRELDQAINLTPIGIPSLDPLNDQFLVRLSNIKWLRAGLRLPIEQLLALWANIDTFGDDSLYQRLFQNPIVLKPVDEAFKLNSDGSELVNVTALTEKHKPTILAALGVAATDLDALIAEISIDNRMLNLANLSQLYRTVVLAKGIKLSIKDLLTLKALTGIDPFVVDRTEDTLRVVEIAGKVRALGFNIAELDYLLRHRFDAASGVAPTEESIALTLDEIRADLQKIAAENTFTPETTDPTGELTGKKLAIVLESADVDRAIALLDGSWTDVVAMRAFIDEHFAVFLSPIDAKNQLVGPPPLITEKEKRFLYVLEPLLKYLRRTLSESLVKQKIGEALKLEAATSDQLLGQWVNSRIDPSKQVIMDLLAQDFVGSDPEENPMTEERFPKQFEAFKLLQKVATIISKFEITTKQLTWVFQYGPEVGWLDLNSLPLDEASSSPERFSAWERLLVPSHVEFDGFVIPPSDERLSQRTTG